MKPGFNLLPPELQESYTENRWRKRLRIGGILFTCTVFLTAAFFFSSLQWAHMQMKKIDQNRIPLGHQLDSVNDLNQENEALNRQLAAMRKIQTDRQDWAKILETINAHLPEDLWLTHFACGPDNKIEIKGMALSLAPVGAFLLELNSLHEFALFSLQSAGEIRDGNSSLTEFSLTGTLQRGSE